MGAVEPDQQSTKERDEHGEDRGRAGPAEGDAIVDYEDKVFDDIQAEPGEKAFIFMHTVPFEGSVGLVNMLTSTRRRKGFDTTSCCSARVADGIGRPAATRGRRRGLPRRTRLQQPDPDPSWTKAAIYACRFSVGALYGFREVDLIEGVKPFNPLDVLDATLTARREGALVMQTWTV